METQSSKLVLVRRSTAGDYPALARLASLAARPRPRGTFLVAEVGRKIVAAVSLDAAAKPLADPAHDTADVCLLLSKWGASLRRTSPATDSLAA
jgi:hypothetical protein